MTRRYVALDRSLGVDVESRVLHAMLRLAAKSGRLETGGVLIGRYTGYGDRVVVTQVGGPTRDSRRSSTAFIRGVTGLKARLRRLWAAGEYYVGEWHFHPFASPTPSARDRRQIAVFAEDPGLVCPHPVMIVVGGDPADAWTLTVVAFVNGAIVELVEDTGASPALAKAQSSSDEI